MSTRLYIDPTAIPYTPTTIRGAWDATGTPSTGKLSVNPTGSNTSISKTETSTTNNYDVLYGRWVSDPLLANTTISGTIDFAIRASEANAAANAFLHFYIYVTQGNSDTPRGSALLSDYIGTAELPTTAAGVSQASVALSNSVSAQTGDRIVLELGVQFQNVVATSYATTIQYGGVNATDLATTNATAARPKWIQFSTNIPLVPKGSTLVDNFDDNSINTTLWDNWGGGNVTETSGRLQVAGTTVADDYFGMDAKGYFNMTDDASFMQLVDDGTSHANRIIQPIVIQTVNGDNSAYWQFQNGQMSCWKNVLGTYTQVGSNLAYPGDNYYWRLREASGTFYFDYSADGTNWTAYANTATPFHMATALISIATIGNLGAVTTASFGYFDNYNSVPSGPTEVAITKSLKYTIGPIETGITKGLIYHIIQKMETLVDDFNDNSLDTAKWDTGVTGAATVSETTGALVYDLPAAAVSGDYASVNSDLYFSLIDSYMFIKVTEVPNPATAADGTLVAFNDANNWVRIVYEGGSLYFQRRVASSQATVASIAYDPVTMAFWRIREGTGAGAGGTAGTMYWDTSPDGTTWTNRASYVHGMAAAMGVVRVNMENYAYQPETNPGGYTIDAFNSLGAVPTEVAITKSLQYAVKKPLSITRSLQYAIKIKQTAITKGLIYRVATEQAPIQRSLAYSVKAEIGITKGLIYTLKPEVGITKDLGYEILPKFELLIDDFNNNVIGSEWTNFGNGQVTEQNQHIEIVTDDTVPAYNLLRTTRYHQLTDSYAFAEIPDAGLQFNERQVFFMVEIESTNQLFWRIQNGAIQAIKKVAGVETGLTYDTYVNATYRWLRIRETAGNIYFDYSANGVIWTNAWTEATPIATGKMLALFMAGNYAPVASDATAIFDNFNYVPVFAIQITKGLTYAVKPEVSITKSLQYAIETEVGQTKSLKYVIATEQAIIKSLKYTVTIEQPAITRSLRYAIAVKTPTTKSLRYAVKSKIAITKSLRYQIAVETAITKSLQYTVKPEIVITKSLKYTVTIEQPAITKQLQYTVTIEVAPITKSLKYTIRYETAPITKSLQYMVKPEVKLELPMWYVVTTGKSVIRALSYRVKTVHVQQKSLAYYIFIERGITKSLAYYIKDTNSIQQPLTYMIERKVNTQKQLRYVVTTEMPVLKSLRYTIKTIHKIELSLRYHVLNETALQKSLTYSIFTVHQTQLPLRYHVATIAGITKSLAYYIKPTVKVSLPLTYVVRSPKTIQLGLTYRVGIPPPAYVIELVLNTGDNEFVLEQETNLKTMTQKEQPLVLEAHSDEIVLRASDNNVTINLRSNEA